MFVTAEANPQVRFRRAIERRALWMAEDAARELPNLPLQDLLQLVHLYAERGSPKYWCARAEPSANEYRRRMEDADRDVLEFIGDLGKTAEQVADRFPTFDVEGLVRAELVRPRRTTESRRAPGAPDSTFYVLTSRGAEAIGLDPYTLHSD